MLFWVTGGGHGWDQCINVRNGIYVSFGSVFLVSHRNNFTFNWVDFSLNIWASDILQDPQFSLKLWLFSKLTNFWDLNTFIDLTINLEIQELTTLNNSISQRQQQNIPTNNIINLLNILSSRFKIKVNVKIFNELSKRIRILDDSSLDNFGKFVEIEWVVSVFMEVFVDDCCGA